MRKGNERTLQRRKNKREERWWKKEGNMEEWVTRSLCQLQGDELQKWALHPMPGFSLPSKCLSSTPSQFIHPSPENKWLERSARVLDPLQLGWDASHGGQTRPQGAMITQAICHGKCQSNVAELKLQVFWHGAYGTVAVETSVWKFSFFAKIMIFFKASMH